MVEQEPSSPRHSAGIVWAYAGWLGLISTILLYGGIRFHLGKGDAPAAIILVGFPTLLLFVIALGRGYHARKKTAQADYPPQVHYPMKVIRSAVTGLLCLGTGVGLLASEEYFRTRQDVRCVREAEAVVASHLQQHPPSGMGVFQGMAGEGYAYPGLWNIGGYRLTATRTAQFSKGDMTIEIVIYPADGGTVWVESVQDQRRFIVPHPRFRD